MKDSKVIKRTSECKHEIVIVIDNYNSYSINAICMFCKKKFESNRALYGERSIIDISEYCLHFGKEYILSKVRDMYERITCSESDLSSYEIGEKIQEELKEEFDETIKQLEKIAKKVREEMGLNK